MQITQATPRYFPRAAQAEAAPSEEAPKPKEKEIPGYTGPTDGRSHYNPDQAGKWRALNKGITALWMHVDRRGQENIPSSGAHMLCFNHQSYADASLVTSMTDRDYRFIAAKEQFVGLIGTAMKDMGAIPVDRKSAATTTIEVVTELMDNGIGTAIAPEGGIKKGGDIHEFKEGPALMALRSKCETMVPVVIHFKPHEVGVANRVGTYLTAGAMVAGGLAAAALGGPAVRAVAGVITGAITGAAVGGGIGFATSKETDIKDRAMGSLKSVGLGALLGAATGGVGGYALGANALWLGAPLSVGAGAVGLGLAKAFNERQDAVVVAGKGIDVAPYRAMENKKEARAKLTADLHANMVEIKKGIEAEFAPPAPAAPPAEPKA